MQNPLAPGCRRCPAATFLLLLALMAACAAPPATSPAPASAPGPTDTYPTAAPGETVLVLSGGTLIGGWGGKDNRAKLAPHGLGGRR